MEEEENSLVCEVRVFWFLMLSLDRFVPEEIDELLTIGIRIPNILQISSSQNIQVVYSLVSSSWKYPFGKWKLGRKRKPNFNGPEWLSEERIDEREM